jgi:hypothetical protein
MLSIYSIVIYITVLQSTGGTRVPNRIVISLVFTWLLYYAAKYSILYIYQGALVQPGARVYPLWCYIIIIHIVTILCSQYIYNIIHISCCSRAPGGTRVLNRVLYQYYSYGYLIMQSNIYNIIVIYITVLSCTQRHTFIIYSNHINILFSFI